jgi:hypothetical protein
MFFLFPLTTFFTDLFIWFLLSGSEHSQALGPFP